uniref:AT-hook containing transcription factor 1 n=1 Tax=Callorhinchus milii TaxID=7868 RepID=A0A4W3K5N2_CALMI
MCELAAQVTSSLLQFPEVTLQALVDDESMQDEALQGKVAIGRNGLAWLASGAHLELVNSVTGERLSAYRFRGIGEQPPTILAIKEFCWLKRTGLLIGLKESEGSILCLYDLGVSRVVKAVFLPGKVTAIEPIINHGGASASTQRLYQSLRWFFGIAAVVTDTGHVLLVDLCLDFSCSQSEQEPADLEVVNRSPAEIPRMRENVVREGRHLCFQLQSPSGVGATALSYVARTNQLAVGFSNGYVQLWNLKTLKKEYYSQLEGGKVPVFAFTFQEPENDPRNCCYLWAVQSAQDSEGDVVSLHLLQLAFGDRKNLTSGQILYEGLEYCEERYTQDLTLGMFSSRTRNTNARLLGCQTVEKFRNHADRDESMNEATSPDTSVSIFSWQVNTYGQRKPSSYLGIFDINRWYHAQMPDSLRAGEQLHNCPYFALWSLDAVVGMTFPHYLLDVLVHERNLSRGVAPSYPPPEQFFNPSTYNFDATCLLNSGLVHITCPGFQKETLNYLKKTGPCLSKAIPDGYSRCLMAGLLSPRLADVHPSSLTQEEQLEAILSAAVESSSLGLITGCIKQWTAEEQPRSAASLRFVLEWTWKKITRTKEELDNICVPLFDGSCNFIDSHTLQSLQHCQMLLSNLTTIVNCFLTEAQELTERGLVDLMNKRTVGSLIAQYAQVVLWFCRAGLLPEGSDDVDVLQLSRPVYNYPVIQNYYTNRRQKLERLSRGRWCSDCLMIDGVVSEIGDHLEQLWRQDEGGTGKYPPSTLHALLDVYLLENVNETTKHTIAIYLILDILSSVSNKNESSIESFPPAFAVPVGLVNLIQGFWLLDHNDHENALDRILHPATSRSISSWQHIRIIQALMCQGEHSKALRYLQAMKPSMSSISELKLHLTVLLFNRCVVEAWNLLQQNASRINLEGLLMHMYELCQEMGLMEDLFKLPFNTTEQECLEKFLTTSGSLQNYEFLLVHHLQRANYVPAIQLNQSLKMNLNDHDPQVRERTAARNSILEQYGKVLPKVQRKLATERANPYRSAVFREVKRPKPLSTMAKRTTSGNVLTRATFINTVLSKVNEVWQGNEKGNHSPINSPGNNGAPSANRSTELCDPFVGTPISKSVGKFSRRFSNSFCGLYSIFTLKCSNPSIICSEARTRAFTTSESAFASFTPQSILRSSLRPTPLGSPSASPSRSLTPPLRAKETKISFLEEKLTVRWTNGVCDVEDGFETESPKEELCVVELSQPDPVEFAGECAFEFEEQHSNGVEAVQEPEGYDVDLIGEHHVEENFTLILDGADEAEPVLTLDANHQPAFSENENVILSQSSETKTGNPDRENSEVSSAEAETEEEPPIKSISLVLGDQGPLEDQHNLSEALPYLPTPIKEATTENLIDVLEDTKQVGESEMEELSELISLPDQADTPMTGRILRSGSFKSKPVKKSQTDEAREVFSEDLKPNQIEAVATPTSVRGQSIKVTEVKGQDDEQNVLMEMQDDKLEKTAVMTPRRSTRKTAAAAGEILGTTLFPKDAVADQNIAGILPTSKVTRRTIASRKDIQERTFAVGELALEQQGEAVSTVRSTRRTMAGRADALLGPEEVDIGQQTEAIFTSTRKKNRKSTIETPCKLPSTLEMSQQDSALSTPSRRTRSRAHLVTVKDISEVTPNVERNSRTSRRRGASAVESTEPPIPVDNVDDQPEEQLTVTFTHMPTRRRPGETPVSQAIGLTEKNYGFSSPHTRSTRKLKGILFCVIFFSFYRTAGNTVSWSPPPVEIKFLSPLVSPVDAPVNKREASEDDSGSIKHRMTLRHKRTKVISAFRKPVTRRKIIQRK